MSHGERDPMTVGMVYEFGRHAAHGHAEARTKEGDVLLCAEHTGDCCYTWVRLRERDGNDETRYFDVDHVYSAYAPADDARELLAEPLPAEDMLRAVMSSFFDHRAAVLVPRPLEEIRERMTRPCPVCGQPNTPGLERIARARGGDG